MDQAELKDMLRRNHLKPNFTYGQNFLVDDEVLSDIVEAAEVGKEDLVVEVGPGIGNLTRLLCERAGFVLSIEKDPKFQPVLYAIKKDHRENFRYEIADVLEYDLEEYIESVNGANQRMPANVKTSGYKVVANIPYYITGKILQMFLNARTKPKSITVLTQKEVAKNIVAGPGDLSLLAISVQLYGEPKVIRTVPAKSFYPAPKVDSAILKIDLHESPEYQIGDEKKFFKILKACFAGKRKQLHNTLASNLHLPKEEVLKILLDLKIEPAIRPQELGIETWIRLAEKIVK